MAETRSYIRVTYVAQVYDKPIVTAHTWTDLIAGLDEYYGVGRDPKVEKLGWHPCNSKWPDEYEGHFEYEVDDWNGGTEIEKVNVYCVDFYPHTRYEVETNNVGADHGDYQ